MTRWPIFVALTLAGTTWGILRYGVELVGRRLWLPR